MKRLNAAFGIMMWCAGIVGACSDPSSDPSGSAGTTGGSGTTGSAGTTGGSGTTGSAGTTGTAGSTGGSGTTGNAGTTGSSGTTGTSGTTGNAGMGGGAGASAGRGGATGNAGTGGSSGGRGGTTGTGGAAGRGGTTGGTGGGGQSGTTGAAGSAGLPALTVSGNKLQDPSGKTIILRGSSLVDIGALYAYNGNSVAGITTRMDKVAAAGVQGHAVRLPVYPKISYNGGTSPYCSPLPYPVGTGPTAGCTPTTPMTAADYVAKVLKPAIDYATGKSLYVIIDYHQIDNAASGASAADATTFWTDVAAQFAGYANVLYEPFNEPIDTAVTWANFKPVVQGWINTIRARAPNNVIVVPSMRWDQAPGDATANPPTGGNLMYTAHIYPDNWKTAFQNQVSAAIARAPVFITEWGWIYSTSQTGVVYTSSTTWGTSFQSIVDGNGASWIAWVTDNGWVPNMFSDSGLVQLTDFGALVKSWLAAKVASDWVR